MNQADLEVFGQRLAAAQDDRLEAAVDLAHGRARLLEAMDAKSAKKRVSRRPVVLALCAALSAVLVLVAFRLWPRPLTFEIGGAVAGVEGRGDDASAPRPGKVGVWMAAAENEVPLRFSDGTRIDLAPGARGRVASVDEAGARFVLERGRAHVRVVHRPGARWKMDVGPFEVRVTGTRFELGWDPVTEEFTLALEEGSVALSGPLAGHDRAVVAGDHVTIVPSRGVFVLVGGKAGPRAESAPAVPAPGDGEPAASEAVGGEPAPESSAAARAAPEDSIPVPPTASAAKGGKAGASAWRALAAAGKYREALAAAEQEGFDAVCASAGSADLLTLADASRFGGKDGRARQALETLRRRFPGDGRAAHAAFLLGKMAFDGRGAYAEAAKWFSIYLAAQPNGALAREAAGRLIEARKRSGDRAGAQRAARDYLARFPGGPHATVAETVLRDAQGSGGAGD